MRRRVATHDLLERVRLTHLADELVANLSHGQQRQLEIGMALAGAPRLILFDEPAAGLSPAERRELVALLRSLPEHMSFVLIEHDLDIALKRGRARDRDAQRPRVEDRHAERDRKRRAGAGHLHGEQAADDLLVATIATPAHRKTRGPILVVEGLDVYYGRAHALQGVSLSDRSRRVRHRRPQRHGQDHAVQRHHRPGAGHRQRQAARAKRCSAWRRTRSPKRGIAYVPQGRRVWPSLTVDETLRLVAHAASATWSASTRCSRAWPSARATAARSCPAASSRCWPSAARCCCSRKLLVMDEPTEGLAPVIVEQVAQALRDLAAEGEIAVLLIEQNLGVAIEVADRIGVMVNGRLRRRCRRAQLAADRELQERLLGVRSGGHDEVEAASPRTRWPNRLPRRRC